MTDRRGGDACRSRPFDHLLRDDRRDRLVRARASSRVPRPRARLLRRRRGPRPGRPLPRAAPGRGIGSAATAPVPATSSLAAQAPTTGACHNRLRHRPAAGPTGPDVGDWWGRAAVGTLGSRPGGWAPPAGLRAPGAAPRFRCQRGSAPRGPGRWPSPHSAPPRSPRGPGPRRPRAPCWPTLSTRSAGGRRPALAVAGTAADATPTRRSPRPAPRGRDCLGDDGRARTTACACWTGCWPWRPRDGHLSVTPVGGRAPGEPRPGFDQQPIEVAALADACARRLRLTGDPRGTRRRPARGAGSSATTTSAIPLFDPVTGGGCDGLRALTVATRTRAPSPPSR